MTKNAVAVNFPDSVVFHVLTVGLLVTVLASWSPVVKCEATLIHGKVTKVRSTDNSSSSTSNGSHSSTRGDPTTPRGHPPPHPSSLPSALKVDVRLGGQDVHLRLDKDRGFEPLKLPVFVLSVDKSGILQSHRARLNDTEFAVYQDIEHEGAFGVFREKDANGSLHYNLQGVVHSQGLVYNLKSKVGSTESTAPRYRRQAVANNTDDKTPDNDKNDDNNKPASDDDDSDADDNGYSKEEELAEFEVIVVRDKSVYGADSVPAPRGPEQPRKKMRAVDKSVTVGPLPSAPSPSLRPLPPLPPSRTPPKRRMRRQTSQGVYVDVVAVVDYGAYKAWYGRSSGSTTAQKQQNTLINIRRYYAIVMNGVNLLYRGISTVSFRINVRLVGIIVSSTASSSLWTEQYKTVVNGARWDRVDASDALTAFKSWAAFTDLLPAYDHLMLFTGYDLSKTTGDIANTGITGLAYTGTVCKMEGQAVSIVEDLGGLQCISTAAHELGHGLSAEHDGDGNFCRSEDRYVMSAGTYTTTPSNKLNPWKFSSCSVNYFNKFIRETLTTARGRQCLNNALTVNGNVPDVTSLMPGQLYNPDDQCRQAYGPQSRLCRGSEFGQVADICTDMYCYDPSTASTCVKLVAARGTTCGNQKWCQSGQCVMDAAAPVADDTCAFGDQPGAAFDGKDCESFVTGFPGYCYQEVVRTRCCSSCAKHKRLLTGCLYGDKAQGCDGGACSFAKSDYLQACCGTCNYGTPFTTTPRSTLPTPATCTDSPTFVMSQMTCPNLIAKEPQLCYEVNVVRKCCKSCRSVASGTSGCEYGDRDPLRCAEARVNPQACSTLKSVCCKTCAADTSSASRVGVLFCSGGVFPPASFVVTVISVLLLTYWS